MEKFKKSPTNMTRAIRRYIAAWDAKDFEASGKHLKYMFSEMDPDDIDDVFLRPDRIDFWFGVMERLNLCNEPKGSSTNIIFQKLLCSKMKKDIIELNDKIIELFQAALPDLKPIEIDEEKIPRYNFLDLFNGFIFFEERLEHIEDVLNLEMPEKELLTV